MSGDIDSTPEWPTNHREDKDVLQAFMVGGVACAEHQQVHLDFVDATGRIFASGSIDFDRWRSMAIGITQDVIKVEKPKSKLIGLN